MSKPKVLIVEDESIIALDMKRTLEKFDFQVTNTATCYNTALNSVRIDKPDIIIMDINLKNSKDGIEITKSIHKIVKIPVIYVTAFIDEKTINRAIETNPVSYLTKPFKEDELKSNILLGLYKNKKDIFISKDYLNIGLNYYFDLKLNKLFYKNLPIKLSKKECSLLVILINARGNFILFKNLEEQLWPSNVVSESTLRTLIYRLRSKLEHKLIETESIVGCRLILPRKNIL